MCCLLPAPPPVGGATTGRGRGLWGCPVVECGCREVKHAYRPMSSVLDSRSPVCLTRAMDRKDVFEHYKSPPEVAEALGISNSAVHQWGDVVPYYSATRLHHLTGGAIPLKPEQYGRGGRVREQVVT